MHETGTEQHRHVSKTLLAESGGQVSKGVFLHRKFAQPMPGLCSEQSQVPLAYNSIACLSRVAQGWGNLILLNTLLLYLLPFYMLMWIVTFC